MGEMQINIVVGEGLGPPAVAINLNILLRDVEGAVPYGFERLQIRCRRRILNDFVVVGDVSLRLRLPRRPVNERFEPNIAGGASND